MKTKNQLQEEIKKLENELVSLKKELTYRQSLQLMYMIKRGKHTFVLQPKGQEFNLIQNGWKKITSDYLIDFIQGFEK